MISSPANLLPLDPTWLAPLAASALTPAPLQAPEHQQPISSGPLRLDSEHLEAAQGLPSPW